MLEAFRRAKENVSINVLIATLKRLDYIIHQVIGFYLDRAGYEPPRIERLEKKPRVFDFYLVHGIRDKEFDRRWRLFYPRGL